MPILRNSEARYGLGVKDTRQASSPSIAPGSAQRTGTIQVGDQSWRQTFLSGLSGLVTKVAEQRMEIDTTDAYLKGAASAGQIESEAAIENDSITRDWEVAGYRDTMGKLTVAKADAKLATDMSWLREQSPAAFQEYLNEQRAAVLPSLEGMSQRQRMAMVPQLALNDRAAIMKHTGEHKKYIFETIQKGYSSDFANAQQKLDTAQAGRDTDGYMGAADTAAGTVWRLWDDPRLTGQQKADITTEYAGVLLAGQHVGVFEKLRDQGMPDGFDKNTSSTILSRLPLDAQEKLGKAYRTAKQASAAAANTDYLDRITVEEAAIKAGTSSLGWDQAKSLMDAGQHLGITTPAKRDEFLGLWLQNAGKFNDKVGVSTAFFSNDKAALLRHGKSDTEAADVALEVMKNVPPPEQFKQFSQAGAQGMAQAYVVAGKIANNSIAALATPDGKFNIQHADMWKQLSTVLDSAKDNPIVATGVLSGLSDANRLRVQRLRELQSERGLSGDMAIAEVLKAETKDANTTPQQRAALSEHNVREDAKFLQGIGDEGWFKRAWWAASGSVFADNAAKYGMAQNPAFASAPPDSVRGQYLEQYKGAVLQELTSQDLAGTNLSQGSRIDSALARVQSRSMETKFGPVIVPKGQTVQGYFGVASGVSSGTVQAALEKVLAPTSDGGRMLLTPLNGKMVYQEVDRNGTPVAGRTGSINPAQVAGEVQSILGQRQQKIAELIGPGIQVDQNGVQFRYNGNNSAGVAERDMLEFRQSLIKHEGVRNTPYKDLSGKLDKQGNPIMTVGVGVSSHNKAYPKVGAGGAVSNQDIQDSFRAATNEAAVTATQLQKAVGVRNSASFKLFAEFAYQGRGGEFQKYAESIRAGDEVQALTWLKKTRAYEMSQPERRKYYEKLTTETLKG